ncbi:MAG TPA: PAS domain S-box protein [Bacteroidia bacterium]|nr:PAS domain S-box protein [Bacteroidia bacterium]HNT80573.1 PAS domain S-box protein [Bacteroidia bacterium]
MKTTSDNNNSVDITIMNALFEYSSIAIVISDEKGRIIKANQESEKLFGYQTNELIGQMIEVLVPRSKRDVHVSYREGYQKAPKQRAMGAGISLEGQHKDGRLIPVEISLSYYRSEEETFIIAFIIDISERKKQEKELHTTYTQLSDAHEKVKELNNELESRVKQRTALLSEVVSKLENANSTLEKENESRKEAEKNLVSITNLYSTMAHNFPGGFMAVIDRNFRYIFADGLGLHHFEPEFQDLKGKKLIEYAPHVSTYIEENIREVFGGQSTQFDLQISNYYFSINAVPLFNADQSVSQILMVFQDITDIKTKETEIRTALNKEKELGELKSRFVTMASHEFRTPLSTILSSVSLIEKYTLSEQQSNRDKHINRIKSAVGNLSDILNDFLSLGKLEEGRIEVKPEDFDLKGFITQLIQELSPTLLEDQSISFRTSGKERAIRTDKQIVRNVFINLISNASKYSATGAAIQVNLELSPKSFSIIITDKGMGISAQDQEHLFERFFRGKNALNIQGTGLGLNIVKRYVSILEGSIEVSSTLGVGSTFKVNLPG